MSQIVSDDILSMEERGERIERVVDIYESADFKTGHDTSTVTENNDTILQTHNAGGDIAKRSYHRLMAASLVLLFVLLLVAVIMLAVMFNTQTTAINQLQTKYNNVTLSRQQLQISYNNLTEERNRLQKERDELNSLRSALDNGWSYFNSSIYYISTRTKNWSESQQDCIGRGADLVIINSNEEKDFIARSKGGAWVWIGLTDIAVEVTWKWVDGSAPTFSFWETQPWQPDDGTAENCAQFRDAWHDVSCSWLAAWICEKRI